MTPTPKAHAREGSQVAALKLRPPLPLATRRPNVGIKG